MEQDPLTEVENLKVSSLNKADREFSRYYTRYRKTYYTLKSKKRPHKLKIRGFIKFLDRLKKYAILNNITGLSYNRNPRSPIDLNKLQDKGLRREIERVVKYVLKNPGAFRDVFTEFPGIERNVTGQFMFKCFESIISYVQTMGDKLYRRQVFLENLIMNQTKLFSVFDFCQDLSDFIQEKEEDYKRFHEFRKKRAARIHKKTEDYREHIRKNFHTFFSTKKTSEFQQLMIELWFLNISTEQLKQWFPWESHEQMLTIRANLSKLTGYTQNKKNRPTDEQILEVCNEFFPLQNLKEERT